MAATQNRKRKKERKPKPEDSPWGSLLYPGTEDSAFSDPQAYDAEEQEYSDETERHLWRDLWRSFSLWSCIASLLFIIFTGGLALLVLKMWTPQDMHDISGYTDKGAARDLAVALRNANGAEVVFTEGEINRYLRDTCRLRQNGLFSVLAHVQGVAVRIHDGYMELVIDRVLSTHFHQTTSVYLSFAREMDHGRPSLRVDLRGGENVMGSLPQGGRIGCVGVPQRFMQMLRPALDTMQDCYPDIVELMDDGGYRPEFFRGRNGQESFVRLVPYSAAPSSR